MSRLVWLIPLAGMREKRREGSERRAWSGGETEPRQGCAMFFWGQHAFGADSSGARVCWPRAGIVAAVVARNATQPSGSQAGCAVVIRLKARRARSAFMAS